MRLIRCDSCGRIEAADEASTWLLVTRDGDQGSWNFCSVTCLATWSGAAL